MNSVVNIFTNKILLTAILAWFVAQVIKVILKLLKERKFDLERLFGSGGMPSSHSAFTVSLATAIGFECGFSGYEFAMAAAFAIIVMYDATNIRRNAGEQATILNKIIEQFGKENLSATGKKLKELLGHTPFQVFWGAVLGIVIAVLRHN